MTFSLQIPETVLLDSTVAAIRGDKLISDLEKMFEGGYRAVATDVAMLDIKAFQDHPIWVSQQIKQGNIMIEAWYVKNWQTEHPFDGITAKPFFWSSCQMETEAEGSFEYAVSRLPNYAEILQMAGIVLANAVPRDTWNVNRPYIPVGELPDELADQLGVPKDANRSAVYEAAKRMKRMDLFDEANKTYCHGMAVQHGCKYMLATDGSVKEV